MSRTSIRITALGTALAFLASLVTAPPDAAAQPPGGPSEVSTSLSDLVTIAVRKSSALVLARATRTRATLEIDAAGRGDEPVITASIEGVIHRETAIPNARAQVISEMHLESNLGISKRISTGGTVSLAMRSLEQARTFGEDPDVSTDSNTTNLSLSIAQPILRGVGVGTAMRQKQARLTADAATLGTLDASARTIRDLVAAYWELAYARANLGVRQKSLALAEAQLELTKKMFGRGAVPDAAVKSAAYGVAVRDELVVRARGDLEAASIGLRMVAGLEVGPDEPILLPSDPLTTDPRELDVRTLVATAISRNPRILAARSGIQLAGLAVDVAANQALPALDLSVSASAVGVGGAIDEAVQRIAGGDSYLLRAGLSGQWEIGGGARAAASAARVDRTIARQTSADVERDIVASVVRVVARTREARQRAAVARRASELAQANLSTELALFRAEKSSNVLVFQRQTELDEAGLLEARAAIDYRLAMADVEYLTGEILEHHGVALAH